jgi:CheY-like chemotaxis protein
MDQRPRLLCVDDEPAIRETLAAYFAGEGFEVRTAATAEQALAEVRRWTPRALILDVLLPDRGGLAILDEVRRLHPAVAVVLVSGAGEVARLARDGGLAVDAVFAKPVPLPELQAALARAGVPTPGSGARPALRGRGGQAGGRLLVVDDDQDVRELLAEYLGVNGYQVDLAASGPEALRCLAAQAPDLVLLDVTMPGMDGIETLAEIARRRPGTPVVMISGNGDVGSARRAVELGAVGYVPKPVDFGYLEDAIAAAIHPPGP